jgi:imidazolonepropionase
MKADLIIRSDNIFTCSGKKDLEIINGHAAAENGRIIAVGDGEAPRDLCGQDTKYIDARGKTVTPGLIDAHTHLIHAGSRERELPMKLKGVPYLEILKMGGGILSTVESTWAATKEELKRKAKKSLKQMLLHGTTTIEAKSGYGLDLETEVKCLQAAAELDREGEIDIVSTYMGAHAVPKEYKEDKRGYIDFMINRVMPHVAENILGSSGVIC